MAETLIIPSSGGRKEIYEAIVPQIKAVVESESDYIANLANVAAILKEAFGFFWVGFYLVKGDELVLGPFQGTLACTRIKRGRGVCGAAFARAESILVEDVDKFEGHIACSSLSRSEVVVPIMRNDKVVGVIDVDSADVGDFSDTDRYYLEIIADIISKLQ